MVLWMQRRLPVVQKLRAVAAGIVGALALMGACAAQPSVEVDEMFQAAVANQAHAIRRLVAAGVPLDVRNAAGATPLLVATHHNSVDAAAALIEAGADVNAKDHIQDSPYLYAGARGHLDILKMTLAHGADVRSLNRYQGTALIPAAERGRVQTVHVLIRAGVDVDHVNKLGWTALIEAIILGNGGRAHQQIVQALVEAGANLNLADPQGRTPLVLARAHGYTAIEKILNDAGAREP